MFHFALPELNTLGVITCTPDFTRSAQVVMCFGLPGRTTNETMELVTMPLVGPLSHELDTSPALTTLSMSGAREKLRRSAGSPSTTDVAWVPDGPKEGEMVTPAPAFVLAKSAASTRERRLRRRVGDQVHAAGALGTGGERAQGQGRECEHSDGADPVAQSRGGPAGRLAGAMG